MLSSGLVQFILLASIISHGRGDPESTEEALSTTDLPSTLVSETAETVAETTSTDLTTTELLKLNKPSDNGFIEMEITSIKILSQFGNTVELSWGEPIPEYNLEWTYGVYYGSGVDEALKGPKLTTKNLYAVVKDLAFCSQYVFAVGVVNANGRTGQPPQNIRNIGTLIDVRAAPQNLRVDFLSREEPCLLISWSASCPNIDAPLGYLVTVFEKSPSRVTLMTEPKTTAVDLCQSVRVIYGKSYDIKVSTDVIGSNSSAIVSYKTPLFLQPYKVQVTSQPDRTFVMYWREPYVPAYIGPYYYDVYVYPGRQLSEKYETFRVNKPIFTFKSNGSEYIFMVGLRSCDGAFKSYLSDPVFKSVYGDTFTLNIEL